MSELETVLASPDAIRRCLISQGSLCHDALLECVRLRATYRPLVTAIVRYLDAERAYAAGNGGDAATLEVAEAGCDLRNELAKLEGGGG